MIDQRSSGERLAWKLFGAPLYYCGDCMRKVKVVGSEIQRSCGHGGQVIAPRRAILAGEGGLNPVNKVVHTFDRAYSAVLGRTR
jgi:hypothetical protein